MENDIELKEKRFLSEFEAAWHENNMYLNVVPTDKGDWSGKKVDKYIATPTNKKTRFIINRDPSVQPKLPVLRTNYTKLSYPLDEIESKVQVNSSDDPNFLSTKAQQLGADLGDITTSTFNDIIAKAALASNNVVKATGSARTGGIPLSSATAADDAGRKQLTVNDLIKAEFRLNVDGVPAGNMSNMKMARVLIVSPNMFADLQMLPDFSRVAQRSVAANVTGQVAYAYGWTIIERSSVPVFVGETQAAIKAGATQIPTDRIDRGDADFIANSRESALGFYVPYTRIGRGQVLAKVDSDIRFGPGDSQGVSVGIRFGASVSYTANALGTVLITE